MSAARAPNDWAPRCRQRPGWRTHTRAQSYTRIRVRTHAWLRVVTEAMQDVGFWNLQPGEASSVPTRAVALRSVVTGRKSVTEAGAPGGQVQLLGFLQPGPCLRLHNGWIRKRCNHVGISLGGWGTHGYCGIRRQQTTRPCLEPWAAEQEAAEAASPLCGVLHTRAWSRLRPSDQASRCNSGMGASRLLCANRWRGAPAVGTPPRMQREVWVPGPRPLLPGDSSRGATVSLDGPRPEEHFAVSSG